MANTLTGLLPTIYESLDVVSREMVGMIPAVNRDSEASRAAVGETISWPVTPGSTAGAITPANVPPQPGNRTIAPGSFTLNKFYGDSFFWTGEDVRGLQNGGKYERIMRDSFAQIFRSVTNALESDLCALVANASRAFGTANTAPFATAGNLSDIAAMRKILEDNGAPMSDLHMVLNSGSAANLRGIQNTLFKVNEAGTDAMLRSGDLGTLQGFKIHESAQIKKPAAGNAVMSTNASGYAIGATDITMTYTSGATDIGDIVTFAGDTNKYVVQNVLGGAGVLKIAAPGLRQAIPTSAQVMTTIAASALQPCFSRNAIVLSTRAPSLPDGGDLGVHEIVQDPFSGLAFDVAEYKQYFQTMYQVSLVWGAYMVKGEHAGILLGNQ
jgi:hypothetical protein